MSSKIDETCRLILISLLSGPKDFAELQRSIQAGSAKTAKRHVKEHLEPEFVRVGERIKGRRTFYSVELTEKGKVLAQKLKGE